MSEKKLLINSIGETIQGLMEIEEVVSDKIMKAITQLEEIRNQLKETQLDREDKLDDDHIIFEANSSKDDGSRFEEDKEPQQEKSIELSLDFGEGKGQRKKQSSKSPVKQECDGNFIDLTTPKESPKVRQKPSNLSESIVELSEKSFYTQNDCTPLRIDLNEDNRVIRRRGYSNILRNQHPSTWSSISEISEIGSHNLSRDLEAICSQLNPEMVQFDNRSKDATLSLRDGTSIPIRSRLTYQLGSDSDQGISNLTKILQDEVSNSFSQENPEVDSSQKCQKETPQKLQASTVEPPAMVLEEEKDNCNEEIKIDPNLIQALMRQRKPSAPRRKKRVKTSSQSEQSVIKEEKNKVSPSQATDARKKLRPKSILKKPDNFSDSQFKDVKRAEKSRRNKIRFDEESEVTYRYNKGESLKRYQVRKRNHICYCSLNKREEKLLEKFSSSFKYKISKEYDSNKTDYLIVQDTILKKKSVTPKFYSALCDNVPIIQFKWISKCMREMKRVPYGQYKLFPHPRKSQAMLNHLIASNPDLPNPFTMNGSDN
ncbi:unnamed protein product [Moneuplotes crassus]|uniref:BRCT domain-containing protein n=1 Tax=Euplotes crassus TaxID=5936 RepID=A0AAD1U0K2_EUPCR|nr:unnamed protein product [Moneuplotes crassus]